MKKIALIDGYGFVFRAYHSLPPLNRPDKTPVGAVYGFTNMLIKLLASLDVSHVAVVFDSGSKTFRNDIYPKYKANRPPCPEDLKPQFPIVRQAAESLNICVLEKVGFEADDIIATIAKKSAAEGYQVVIVSSDKDLMQLVDERIVMYDAMKNKLIGINEVKEKFFVEPKKVLDILSLMGDSSDNVPGVKGIGPKTAAELIEQFGTLEEIFLHLDQIKQEKRRELLAAGEENAKLSKTLITLDENVEMGISLKDLEVKNIEPHKLLGFLTEQGFHSLVTRVKKEFHIEENYAPKQEKPQQHTTKKSVENRAFSSVKKTKLTSVEELDKVAKKAALNGIMAIDFSTSDDEIKFITISTFSHEKSPEEIFYFQVESEQKQSGGDLFNFEATQENQDLPLDCLKKILEDQAIKKIFFNAKDFLNFAKVSAFEDVALINHLLTSSTKNNLCEIIEMNLNEDLNELGFGEFFDKKEIEDEAKKIDFFCFKNFAIAELYQIFSPRIFSEKLNEAYFSYELPSLEILAAMENYGVKIDSEKLHQLSQEFGKKIEQLSKEIYELAGCEFNIASPKQLGEILFEKLGLASSKKSKKTGALSTNSKVLDELDAEGFAIAGKILEFRKFSKLKNTYSDALPKEINKKTGRVHTHFSTTSTITGRLNSSSPNLQNIPIKTQEGKEIRKCFIAEKNHFLLSADYSQIELRVIAHVAKIDALTNAFAAGKDIHKITAAQVFGISEEEVDEEKRSQAKAINFGIIYGISAFGLARQLGISKHDADTYIKSYLATYPGIDTYMKETVASARTQGFVQTISGRKCFIFDINNKNFMIRSEAERQAINAPIQGSAADIVKMAMIRLSKKFFEEKLQAKMILQIHDEIIVEAPEDEVEIVKKIMKSEMEKAVILQTPLKVDISVGTRWE
jgi:DNA polymerase-1